MPKFRLRGLISRGMFPNEVTFVVQDHDGNEYVVLVPEELIEDARGGSATIQVRIVDRENDVVLVRVPGEPLGSSTVSVNASQLAAI